MRSGARFLAVVLTLALSSAVMAGCDSVTDPQASSEPESTAESTAVGPTSTPTTSAEPDTSDAQPSIEEMAAAVLAIAREEYPTMPIESATVYAIGHDAQGTLWVQAWTTTSPEFEGEQGEQWFVTYDGESWVLVEYGTGLDIVDFPEVSEWEQLQ